jgi:hypothetical protein
VVQEPLQQVRVDFVPGSKLLLGKVHRLLRRHTDPLMSANNSASTTSFPINILFYEIGSQRYTLYIFDGINY